MDIEKQYYEFLQALVIVRMIAGNSYDNLNMKAAWIAIRVGKERIQNTQKSNSK